jgi:hypothetical protein
LLLFKGGTWIIESYSSELLALASGKIRNAFGLLTCSRD